MIKISYGNSKIGRIPNTSVRPVIDCARNVPCREKCYALKSWKMYPNVKVAWSANANLWKLDYVKAADSIVDQLHKMRKPPRYFRVHVAGDFMNQLHLNCWKYIALMCPQTTFMAFTKKFNLSYAGLPNNLVIRASMWPGWEDKAPKRMSRGWVQDGTEGRIPNGAIECKGSCDVCHVCWDKPKQDVWFKIH
jgi:hypothetical protein